MTIQLTKLYDARNLGELTNGSPQVIKAEFVDAHGVTYFGWKFTDDNEVHFTGHNHRFFQSCLPNGKNCQRKVSAKINEKLLSIISDHMQKHNIVDWYSWSLKI